MWNNFNNLWRAEVEEVGCSVFVRQKLQLNDSREFKFDSLQMIG